VAAHGVEQAGIARPELPQPGLVSLVLDLHAAPAPLLAGLGRLIARITATGLDRTAVAAGDLTVTVGVGPALVAAVDPTLPGAHELPAYRREEVPDHARGGDLWVQVCGSDRLAVAMAVVEIQEWLADRATVRWSQRAWRGDDTAAPGGHPVPRNLQGFQDGIVNPRTSTELSDSVWLPRPARLAGGTIAVVRRFRFDLAGWRALGVHHQQQAVGRELVSSRALSGGDDVDVNAKTPDGRYRIPLDAHVRRANPSALGVGMMLRRSYSIDDPEPGLLFVSFQRSLRTFTATMDSLDHGDRMLGFATTTATGTFLVLPGFSADRPLGSMLFG